MVEKVSFTVYMKDMLSGGLKKLAGVGNSTFAKLKAGQDTYQAEASQSVAATAKMNTSLRGLNATGGMLAGTFRSLMKGFGLVFLIYKAGAALASFDVQARADAQMMAALTSTNYAAGRSFEDLKKQASALQGTTLFGDEATQEAQSLLLTFKQIRGEMFDKTIPIIQDVATAMKMDLKSASLQVGKALNDPAAGLSMLTRVGITFSDQQKAVIKSLQATGDIAGAQAVILEELRSQFGGSAEAAARAGTGPLKMFGNRMSDIGEKAGGFLNVLVQGLLPALMKIATALEGLFGWIDKNKEVVIAMTQGIGIVLGLYALWTAAQWALNAAMVANPIGLIVVGIGALVGGIIWAWNRFEGFRKVVLGFWGVTKLVFGWIKTYGVMYLKALVWPITLLWNKFEGFRTFLKEGLWNTVKSVFTWIGDKLKSMFSMFWSLIRPVLKLLGIEDAFNTGAAKGIRAKETPKTDAGGSYVSPLAEGADPTDPYNTSVGSGAISGMAGSGTTRNITITIGSLIESFNVHTTNMSEAITDIQDQVKKALLMAVNDANLAAG